MFARILFFLIFSSAVYAQNAPVGYGAPSTAVEASRILKTGRCALFDFQANTGASSGWVMLFDSATVPADGAVTPVKWYQLAANSTLGVSWPVAPLLLINGCVLVFSSTGPFTKTGSATATFSGEVQ